jgi:hypothetical protein
MFTIIKTKLGGVVRTGPASLGRALIDSHSRDIETQSTLVLSAINSESWREAKHTIAQAIPRMTTLMTVRVVFLIDENKLPLFIMSQKMAGRPSVLGQ